jgi:hypothetical protein
VDDGSGLQCHLTNDDESLIDVVLLLHDEGIIPAELLPYHLLANFHNSLATAADSMRRHLPSGAGWDLVRLLAVAVLLK